MIPEPIVVGLMCALHLYLLGPYPPLDVRVWPPKRPWWIIVGVAAGICVAYASR
jgi:hypothetical protein